MNCVNGFCTAWARNKHYGYCSSNGHGKVKITSEKENWLKSRNGQYQFKVPFMVYVDSESVLKVVYEQYIKEMNQMKTKRKGKAPYKE